MNSRMGLVLILFLAAADSSCAFRDGYREGLAEGREAYLRDDLSMMRDGIKKYTSDLGPPQSLDELVKLGYMSHIPRDPITDKADWVIVQYNCSTLVNCKKGIKDVHSASTAKSTKGSSYSDW